MTQPNTAPENQSKGNDGAEALPEHEVALESALGVFETLTADPAKPEALEAAKTALTTAKKSLEDYRKKPKPQAPVVPEKYDFKLPEGSYLDPNRLAALEAKGKEGKWTAEQAAERLTFADQEVKAAFEYQASRQKQVSDGWLEELKADPKLGGDNLPKTVGLITEFLKTTGGQSVLDLVVSSGFAYRKDVREWLYGMALKSQAGAVPQGAPAGGGAPTDPVSRRYKQE